MMLGLGGNGVKSTRSPIRGRGASVAALATDGGGDATGAATALAGAAATGWALGALSGLLATTRVTASPITGAGAATTGAGVGTGSAGSVTASVAALSASAATSAVAAFGAERAASRACFSSWLRSCASRNAASRAASASRAATSSADSTATAGCAATAGAGASEARVTSTRFLRTSTCTVRDLPDASAVRNSVVDLRVSVMRLPALSSAAPCCLRRSSDLFF